MADEERLFGEFPPVSTETWIERIKADLKGADYREKLVWHTDEGIPVQPFYREEDLGGLDFLGNTGTLKPPSSGPNSWTICQDVVPGSDAVEGNNRILKALEGGARAIRVQLGETPLPDGNFLGTLLDRIRPDETEILFQGYLGADAIYTSLLDLMAARGLDPANLKGCLGADPLGKMAVTGIPVVSFMALGELVRDTGNRCPAERVIDVNGALFQEAGGTLAEEVAFTLAMANEYMVILTAQGIDPADVLHAMQVSLASGANYFMEIAKLRAFRILWTRICQEYGLDPLQSRIPVHSTTSRWNMTLYDPHVNMLRGTTEAMSSILGGADLVTVLPYDHPYGNSSAFSDRIARNVQIILRDEAYFGRVSDPAAGSYYIESLTASLAGKAWDLFRETEEKGGFRQALESGRVQEMIMASKQVKLDRFASGKGHLLGTNAFPNFNEMIVDRIRQAEPSGLTGRPMVPLVPFRAASMFEEVRLETERSRTRPRVFLLKHGNPAWATARAAFSSNFFACAGYEIIDRSAFKSLEKGIEAARSSGAGVVVLCSSDDAYASMATQVAGSLKGQAILVVAGFPKEDLEVLKAAGIDHFIHLRSNLLETLRHFNKLLLG